MVFRGKKSNAQAGCSAAGEMTALALALAIVAVPAKAADFSGETAYRDGELIEQYIEETEYALHPNIVCGQSVDDVVLFEYDQDVEWVIEEPSDHKYVFEELETTEDVVFAPDGIPTIPARTPMFYCITGETLVPNDIPPPPEYCCH